MGWAMLSKSLIQFSVDVWGHVPSLLFTWGQIMGYTKNGMFLNFRSDLSFSNCLLLGAAFSELLRCYLPGLESYTSPPKKIGLCFQVVTILFS